MSNNTFDLNKSACNVLKGVQKGNPFANNELYDRLWKNFNPFLLRQLQAKYHSHIEDIFIDATAFFWQQVKIGRFSIPCDKPNEEQLQLLYAYFTKVLRFRIMRKVEELKKEEKLKEAKRNIIPRIKQLLFRKQEEEITPSLWDGFDPSMSSISLLQSMLKNLPVPIWELMEKYFVEKKSLLDIKKEIAKLPETGKEKYSVKDLKKIISKYVKEIMTDAEKHFIPRLTEELEIKRYKLIRAIFIRKQKEVCSLLLRLLFEEKLENPQIADLMCLEGYNMFCTAEQVKKKKSECLKDYYLNFPNNLF